MYFQPEHLELLPFLQPQHLQNPLVQPLLERFYSLHEKLHHHMLAHNLYLFPHLVGGQPLSLLSVTSLIEGGLLCTRYLRAAGICTNVERLMGLEDVHSATRVQPRRHPVIELRLQAQHLVVEFVLSADAWWDQENLMGRLSLPRYYEQFYECLMQLDDDFRMGFWQGIQLHELHLPVRHLRRRPIFEEWMHTFEVSKDNLRIGRWYTLDDSALREAHIETTLLSDIKALYALYLQASWSGENSYRHLYRKQSSV